MYELQATGFPTEFAYPKEGAILFANWFDVLKGAPHPELAQELVNFLLGPAVVALAVPLYRNTALIRRSAVAVARSAASTSRCATS